MYRSSRRDRKLDWPVRPLLWKQSVAQWCSVTPTMWSDTTVALTFTSLVFVHLVITCWLAPTWNESYLRWLRTSVVKFREVLLTKYHVSYNPAIAQKYKLLGNETPRWLFLHAPKNYLIICTFGAQHHLDCRKLWATLLSCFELGELSSVVGTKEISQPMTGPSFRDCSSISIFRRQW